MNVCKRNSKTCLTSVWTQLHHIRCHRFGKVIKTCPASCWDYFVFDLHFNQGLIKANKLFMVQSNLTNRFRSQPWFLLIQTFESQYFYEETLYLAEIPIDRKTNHRVNLSKKETLHRIRIILGRFISFDESC